MPRNGVAKTAVVVAMMAGIFIFGLYPEKQPEAVVARAPDQHGFQMSALGNERKVEHQGMSTP